MPTSSARDVAADRKMATARENDTTQVNIQRAYILDFGLRNSDLMYRFALPFKYVGIINPKSKF
jgi:hypothetical protein